MKARICFEVDVDAVHMAILRHALQSEVRRAWLRAVLEEAVERFLSWATGTDNVWRVKVVTGSVGEVGEACDGEADRRGRHA
jgi:hypothetical protein